MTTDNIPYIIIIAGIICAVVAGLVFPSYYSVAMAQANAYDAGRNDEEGDEE